MNRVTLRLVVCAVSFGFLPSFPLPLNAAESAAKGNWPHWRGPTGNGVSPDGKPPVEWSETKNVKWKVEIPGSGSGSPIVWGDRVFVVTAVGKGARDRAGGADAGGGRDSGRQRRGQGRGQSRRRRGGRGAAPTPQTFKLFCFDRSTGKVAWEKTAVDATPHEGHQSSNNFAPASPCTDGEHVYAHFGSRGLFCYSLDGKLKWKRTDFGKMRARNGFGEGSSPTLHGDVIIVPWDHEGQSFLAVLNKKNGETIWKVDRDEPTCWATPLVVEHGGEKQIITNGQNFARAYDLKTGDELWRCSGQTQRPVASPVSGHGLVFIGSGHKGSFLGAFRLDGAGDIEGTKSVVWSVDKNTPDVPSPVLSGRRLYFFSARKNILSCHDAVTGKAHYEASRVDGLDSLYASPVAAGGKVYLTSRNGTTVVIEDADKLKIVATNSVGETVDASPAVAGTEMFIRGSKHLFCLAE